VDLYGIQTSGPPFGVGVSVTRRVGGASIAEVTDDLGSTAASLTIDTRVAEGYSRIWPSFGRFSPPYVCWLPTIRHSNSRRSVSRDVCTAAGSAWEYVGNRCAEDALLCHLKRS
jgi:hypothetical protein